MLHIVYQTPTSCDYDNVISYIYTDIILPSLLTYLINFRVTGGQPDTSICTQNLSDTASALPKLNNQFTSRMEWKIIEEKKWVYIDEYYDDLHNIAAVKITGLYDPGKTVLFISDYSSKEYFTVQDNVCTVSALKDSDTFTLPFSRYNTSADQVLSVHKALSFGASFKEQYINTSTVRDIAALYFESCVYDNTTQKTSKIGFYFSDSGSGWRSPSGSLMVPLRTTIHRKVGHGQESYETHEQYDIVYFQEFIDDFSVFQIPDGVYCEGRKSSRPPLPVPSYFSFRAEMVVPNYQSIGAYDEWYDYTRKLVRIDSRPMQGGVVVVPVVARKDFHDFNAGVSYLLNMASGECDIVPLSPDIFDSKLVDPNHIAIKSPKEFFEFSTGDFIYSGQKTERSITMDTWIGTRQNFPPGLNKTSYWEWYFSTDKWLISEFGPPIRQVPMRLKITIPDMNTTFIYNIFDFSESEPDISDFDVSFCYEDETIRHFQLTLKGKSWAVSPKPKLFKYNIAIALAKFMVVSYIRVQVIRTDFDNNGAYIVFRLLDLPSAKGDVKHPVSLVSSDDAYHGLLKAVDTGSFTFTSTIEKPVSGTEHHTFTGVPGSLVEVMIYPNGTTVDIRDLSTSGSSSSTSVTQPSSIAISTAKTTTVKPPTRSPFITPTPKPRGTTKSQGVHSPLTSVDGWHGGSVAGIAIAMTVIGLVLGAISTFFVLKQRSQSYGIKEHLTMDAIHD